MTSQLLIIAISTYILSLIGGFIMMVAVRDISKRTLKILFALHVATLAVAVIAHVAGNTLPTTKWLVLCTGVLLAGIFIRNRMVTVATIYFSLWLVSVGFFVYSPTRMLVAAYSGNLAVLQSEVLALGDNFFLTPQHIYAESASDSCTYKIYRKKGVIKATVMADIMLQARADSVCCASTLNDTLQFTAYYQVQGGLRDTLLVVPINEPKKNKITRGNNK